MNQSTSNNETLPIRNWQLLLFALLVILVLALHTYHFVGRSYRQDEAGRVHRAIENTIPETVQLMSHSMHPPAWQITIDVWIELFGQREPVTRYLSTLYTALALAMLFRFATDLFGRPVGLITAFLFGTSAFIQFFCHELRPYALLTLCSIGLHLAFVRWLRRPGLKYGLLYVAFGAAGLYTHFHASYVVAAQAIFFLLFVSWQPARYLRALGLFAAIGLSFLGWLPSFIHSFTVTWPGGIDWYSLTSDWHAVEILHDQMQIRPVALGQFLLLLGLLPSMARAMYQRQATNIKRGQPFRPILDWRKGYIITVPLAIMLLAFFVNTFVSNLTPRNLITLLPPLFILLAVAMHELPARAQIVLGCLILIPAITTFRSFISTGPYQEMTDYLAGLYDPGDPVVIDADIAWQHVPLTYYTAERLPVQVPNERIFHLAAPGQEGSFSSMAEEPAHLAVEPTGDNLNAFSKFLGDAEQVWVLYPNDERTRFNEAFMQRLEIHYIPVAHESFTDERSYTVVRYRRVPDEQQDIYTFGESIVLRAWSLRDDTTITPCQTITLETWWVTDAPLDTNYGLSSAITNAEGVGVANIDDTPAGILTGLWEPGALYLDERTLTVPCDLAQGQYHLLLVMYDYPTLTPLSVIFTDGSPVGEQAYLTTLTVE